MAASDRLCRARVVRIFDTRGATVIVGPDGRAHRIEAESSELTRALLELLLEPRTRAEIRAHVEALTGTQLSEPSIVDELLELLLQTGAIEPAPSAPAAAPRWRGEKLVLGLCGAVASMHAPGLVTRLCQRGFEVRIAATKNALRFINGFALEALVHHPVESDLFEGPSRVPHIELARWADVVLVWPATGTTISRLATGDHDSLVSAIALATRAPVVVAPSMNAGMYAGAAVQRNLAQLAADGMHVLHPAFGIEVADAPADRSLEIGPAPPVGVIVQLVEAVLALRRRQAPKAPADWDEIYTSHPEQELPWYGPEPDPDLVAALERLAPEPALVLDVGTGHGRLARAAAERGHRVVATDVSSSALKRAAELAPSAPVIWLEDDITNSHLRQRFQLALDRGCLHVLGGAAAARYASSLAALIAPGGFLILKTHDSSEGERHGTTPQTRDSLSELFGPRFEIVEDRACSFAGPSSAPAARLFVLKRTHSS